MKPKWTLLLALLPVACWYDSSPIAYSFVEVDGIRPVIERLAFAGRVTQAVRSSDLGEAVLEQFAALGPADLDGLGVATQRSRGGERVFVACRFKHSDNKDLAVAVAEVCRKRVEATMRTLREEEEPAA